MGLGPLVVIDRLVLRRVEVVELRRHHRCPEVPLVIYLAQLAAVAQRHQSAVDLREQLFILLADGDGVDYLSDRRSDEFDLGVEARRVERDRLVEERRVETSVGEVLIGVGLDDIGADLNIPHLFEDHLRVAFLQRPRDLALQILKALDRIVLAAHGELKVGLVVGDREVDRLLMLWGHLKAVDGDVVKVAVEAGDQVVPGVVDIDGFASHLRGKRVDDVHLEADEFLRVLRIGEHIGEAALGVAAPA